MDNESTEFNPVSTARGKYVVVCVAIFLLLLSLVFYTFLHEGGHGLVGLLFGGKLSDFSINFFDISAHVGIEGEFSQVQNALISVAGVSLPLLTGWLLLIHTRKTTEISLDYFKTVFFLIAVNSLLAWIIFPIIASTGRTVGDDSFNFLTYTQLPPLVESAIAVLLYGISWVGYIRLMGGRRVLANRLRSPSFDVRNPGTRNTLVRLAAVGVVVLAVSYTLARVTPNTAFAVPAGFRQVAEIDLSQNGLTEQSIYRFQLDAPTRVTLFILLNEVTGAPVNIRLVGPEGYQSVFLNMSDPKTNIGRASVSPKEAVFEKGDYELLVTLPKCKGNVKAYIIMDNM